MTTKTDNVSNTECQDCGRDLHFTESIGRKAGTPCYRCRHPDESDLPDCIVAALVVAEKRRDEALAHVAEASIVDSLLSDLEEAHGIVGGASGTALETWGIFVTFNHTTSMDTVKTVLRAARAAGLVRKKVEKPGQYADIGRLSYAFEKVTLAFFFPIGDADGSGQCRYVKVGEEVTPKYKLVCPDTLDVPDVAEEEV